MGLGFKRASGLRPCTGTSHVVGRSHCFEGPVATSVAQQLRAARGSSRAGAVGNGCISSA